MMATLIHDIYGLRVSEPVLTTIDIPSELSLICLNPVKISSASITQTDQREIASPAAVSK